MYASLGCGALNARCTSVFFVSLGVTLDSAETTFAKTPFSWFMIKAQQFWGKIRSYFHLKFVTLKIFRANFALQTCHLNTFAMGGDDVISLDFDILKKVVSGVSSV